MIRWISQRDTFSCVPIAFLNLHKWLGNHVTYGDLNRFRRLCGTTFLDGSSYKCYDRTIKKIKRITIKKRNNVTIDKIKEVVGCGGLAVLGSAWRNCGQCHRHMFIISKVTNKSLFCINVGREHRWFSNDDFDYYFMDRWNHYPWAYFITKL